MYKNICEVTLFIRAPIMCATATKNWGIDVMFHRNTHNNYSISNSHVRGKLREAMKEIMEVVGDSFCQESLFDKLFGGESVGLQNKSALTISDFSYCDDEESETRLLHRIAIHPTTGTARENSIVFIEAPFAPGKITAWRGSIEFISQDEEEAKNIQHILTKGLQWITGFGAYKGIGFGSLHKVDSKLVSKPVSTQLNSIKLNSTKPSVGRNYSLKITPLSPFTIGNIRRRDNYLESKTIIPGNTIKGSLCNSINYHLGITPIDTPIGNDKRVQQIFPMLFDHFANLRITHAFPATENKRPVAIPFSTVVCKEGDKNEFYDVALVQEATTFNDIAPAFQSDWKGNDFIRANAEFGWAYPQKVFQTRTAIEKNTRTARENKLYTYEYVCPYDAEGNEINWYADIYIPEMSNENSIQIYSELEHVINHFFNKIGKRDAAIKSELNDGRLSKDNTGEEVIVVLQSDCLMVNPEDLQDKQDEQTLRRLYGKYWRNISNDNLELVDYFAMQKLVGGYLVKRYQSQKPYYPFYLTQAGSVFRLKQKGASVSRFVNEGLPVPAWAEDKYGTPGKPLWKSCPFLPQNGYGEIMVNLEWHWQKKLGGKI